ncbi:toll/interleukin-1 receptor domain-containing protein [Aeromonas enteropelogenes]|uniref:toll/interleukin-1 receptor domain-containing protein n=1 Tax=Aeromonas enteropelogenes TaxID=29489 RepID=UPI003BA3C918
MPVFISYRHKDRDAALVVASVMHQHNIEYYLDVLDPQSQTTDQITDVITERMKTCTHLIAVVSENTGGSWWVPFEIGEATIIDNRIATYQVGYVSDLPDYLKKWPKMTTRDHLRLFALAYKADFSFALNRRSGNETIGSIRTSEQFHYNLKRNLGQVF